MERIENLSNEDYHSNREYHSQSRLKKVLRSLAHFQLDEAKETPQMISGRIVHDALLTPNEFTQNYTLGLEGDRRTKEGKAKFKEFEENCEANGLTPINSKDYEMLMGMIEAVHAHPIARNILSIEQKEVSYFVELPEFPGLKLKCRPDLYDAPAIFDLKTTKDASEEKFSKDIVNYGYDFQAAFYIDVVNAYNKHVGNGDVIKDFIFWCVEKEPPYAMAFYVADEDVIHRGRALYMRCLQDLAMQLEKVKEKPGAVWPGYDEKVNPIYLPKWA